VEELGEFYEAKKVVIGLINKYEAAEQGDYFNLNIGKEKSKRHKQ